MTEPRTAKCEDCGKRVSRYFGPAVARGWHPQGVRTATGYICGPCMVKRHEHDDES